MRKILFGGVFDLLHCGHIRAFKFAKSFGDYLIVQIASDKESENKSGKGRPIISETERCEMVRSIKYVDEVLCYSEQIPQWPQLLDDIKPNVIIINLGKKHINAELEDECLKRNIAIIKMPRQVPSSFLDTTAIINKIKLLNKC